MSSNDTTSCGNSACERQKRDAARKAMRQQVEVDQLIQENEQLHDQLAEAKQTPTGPPSGAGNDYVSREEHNKALERIEELQNVNEVLNDEIHHAKSEVVRELEVRRELHRLESEYDRIRIAKALMDPRVRDYGLSRHTDLRYPVDNLGHVIPNQVLPHLLQWVEGDRQALNLGFSGEAASEGDLTDERSEVNETDKGKNIAVQEPVKEDDRAIIPKKEGSEHASFKEEEFQSSSLLPPRSDLGTAGPSGTDRSAKSGDVAPIRSSSRSQRGGTASLPRGSQSHTLESSSAISKEQQQINLTSVEPESKSWYDLIEEAQDENIDDEEALRRFLELDRKRPAVPGGVPNPFPIQLPLRTGNKPDVTIPGLSLQGLLAHRPGFIALRPNAPSFASAAQPTSKPEKAPANVRTSHPPTDDAEASAQQKIESDALVAAIDIHSKAHHTHTGGNHGNLPTDSQATNNHQGRGGASLSNQNRGGAQSRGRAGRARGGRARGGATPSRGHSSPRGANSSRGDHSYEVEGTTYLKGNRISRTQAEEEAQKAQARESELVAQLEAAKKDRKQKNTTAMQIRLSETEGPQNRGLQPRSRSVEPEKNANWVDFSTNIAQVERQQYLDEKQREAEEHGEERKRPRYEFKETHRERKFLGDGTAQLGDYVVTRTTRKMGGDKDRESATSTHETEDDNNTSGKGKAQLKSSVEECVYFDRQHQLEEGSTDAAKVGFKVFST